MSLYFYFYIYYKNNVNIMEGENCDNKKNDRDNMSSNRDIPEPPGFRHIGLQTDRINQRLLEYNVRALWLCVPIIYIVFYFV